jgi:hypothetical protein
MNLITNLTSQQLRQAASLKDQIQSLEKELGRILGSTTNPVAHAEPKKKFKMSAAARAKISAAAKARWAKVKTAKPTMKSVKPAAKAPAKRKKMSAAAKAKLSALAKVRWAKIKKAGKKSL